MPDTVLLLAEEKMEMTLESLKRELGLIRTGRANPAVLKGVRVNYYGVPTPIDQMASVSVPEAQLIQIKPYDKTQLKEIEKAIQLADLNLVPQNDGTVIRIVFPPLTEQRRKDLVKEVKGLVENSKVACRNIRRDANEQLKKLEKEKLVSEDELKGYNEDVQKLTDKFIAKVEEIGKEKEKQIMEI